MEAFTITRDDTNALLKFNFELPISETALQIDCNFLEGTASSLPACHVREAPEQALPAPGSWEGLVQSRSPQPRKSLKSPPAPPSAGWGRTGPDPQGGAGGVLYYLGLSGGASSSQSRRSFSFALGVTPQIGFVRAGQRGGGAGRPESQQGCPALAPTPAPLPPPKQSPAPGPGYVTCAALPAPRSPHPPLARLVRVPLPGTHKVAAPGRLNPPLSSSWGERGGDGGSGSGEAGTRETNW